MPPLNEQQIREIVRDERRNLDAGERYTIQKLIQMFDGRNFQLGLKTGTKFGLSTSQKLAFHGLTPVIQQAKINDPAGAATDTDDEARAAINDIIDVLEAYGFTASSA